MSNTCKASVHRVSPYRSAPMRSAALRCGEEASWPLMTIGSAHRRASEQRCMGRLRRQASIGALYPCVECPHTDRPQCGVPHGAAMQEHAGRSRPSAVPIAVRLSSAVWGDSTNKLEMVLCILALSVPIQIGPNAEYRTALWRRGKLAACDHRQCPSPCV